jgi:EAL domain-containing protein (putative c-di-GMP-specific phosphodiesterase class I)
MARSLGLEVAAEGVETQDESTFLRREGCQVLQGFLFAHPVQAADFDRLLVEMG